MREFQKIFVFLQKLKRYLQHGYKRQAHRTFQETTKRLDELTRLLEIYGFEISNKGKTSGSRVVFKNGDKKPIMLHKPHPGNIVKGYALKQVFNYLKELGLIK